MALNAGLTHLPSTSVSSDKKCPGRFNEERIWIGNLDPKLSEYSLLKLVQKHGKIKNFDFLFHQSGPYKGQPRGYAFVTFQEKISAQNCINCMDGKKILSKNISVRWAHQAPNDRGDELSRLKRMLPALGSKPETGGNPANKEKLINAIESKLNLMKNTEDESFKITVLERKTSTERRGVKPSDNSRKGAQSYKRYKPYDKKR